MPPRSLQHEIFLNKKNPFIKASIMRQRNLMYSVYYERMFPEIFLLLINNNAISFVWLVPIQG